MSEHQYVGFRAIDRPVSEENLEYMRQQSSRAKITPLAFDNEYHFANFQGDGINTAHEYRPSRRGPGCPRRI